MTFEDNHVAGAWAYLDVEGHTSAGCGGHALVLVHDTLVLLGGADRSVTPSSNTVVLTRGSTFAILIATDAIQLDVYRPFKLMRTGAGVVAMDEWVYMFGGQEPSTGLCFNDVLKFNIKTRNWETVCPASGKPPPRHAHTVGKVGQHSFLVFGGASQNHEYGPADVGWVLADVWVFNTMASEWKRLVPGGVCPSAREMAAGVMISRHEFVVTGGRGHGGVLLDDAVLLNLDSDPSWKPVMRHESLRRCAHTAVVMNMSRTEQEEHQDKTVALFGGFVGRNLSDELVLLDVCKKTCIRIVNDQTDAWPNARFGHAACTLRSLAGNDVMCVYGGLGVESDSTAWHVWDPHTHGGDNDHKPT